MRFASVKGRDHPKAVIVRDDRVLIGVRELTMSVIIQGGAAALDWVRRWLDEAPDDDWVALADVDLEPAIDDPGAIYTVGHNYLDPDDPTATGHDRPLIYGKAASSVAAPGATLTWDRSISANVDAECELGVVIGQGGSIFGYTIINDVSSRDPWLDGDQWLLGKSMRGFCPVGPWLVTPDELDPGDVRLGCRINDEPIQDGRTSQMRFSIDEVIAYIGRHVELRPGDVIATGTPARLATPPGPDRHLRAGDVVTCWIEGIGELTTTIA
jgi:2-keto-4-pentenoate hydratase/2-oxohepta-3-ene-1,7-dioic acid hydratase in catechol pathway